MRLKSVAIEMKAMREYFHVMLLTLFTIEFGSNF